MAYSDRHGAAFDEQDRRVTAAMDRAEARRRRETFDGIVRMLLSLERPDAMTINGAHILEAAARVKHLSPCFSWADLNACVKRLEYGYAAHRAIHEASHG